MKYFSSTKSRWVCGAVVLSLLWVAHAGWATDDGLDDAMSVIRPEAIRATMTFLSDDLLEGRGTGTRGYELAAKFMATQFEALGLQPAGESGTFFQSVPLRSMRPDENKSSFALLRSGKLEMLHVRKDYIISSDPARSQSSVEASVIFAGFGVTAPELGYDDYKGIDVRNKIVALLFGAPEFQTSIRAHYTSTAVKAQTAAAHGAVGLIVLDDPALERIYSFNNRVHDLSTPELRWLDRDGRPNDYYPQLKVMVSLSPAATQNFFRGSRHTAEQVFTAARDGRSMSFALPLIAKIETATEWHDVASSNVVAKLDGSDPFLRAQYLVYSAHLDHLGIGEPVQGDRIYNGAIDNASGAAILLETARAFGRMSPRPRRSILFVATTGEEAGLLGSDYFVHYPPVPRGSMIADVNMDGDVMLWPLQDIIAFGAEHSTLDAAIRKATQRLHLAQSPDPMPEQVIFIRGDQYSFVRQGIPSVALSPGLKSVDPNIDPLALFSKWEQSRYHQPQDDMDQPGLDFDAAAKYAKLVFVFGYAIAQESQRPAWNKGDFFDGHNPGKAN